jgi:hypothetical protein
MAAAVPEAWESADYHAMSYADGSTYEAEYVRPDGVARSFAPDAGRAIRELRRLCRLAGRLLSVHSDLARGTASAAPGPPRLPRLLGQMLTGGDPDALAGGVGDRLVQGVGETVEDPLEAVDLFGESRATVRSG